MHSRQRQSAYRLKSLSVEKRHGAREAAFPIERRYYQRLLALKNPFRDALVGGNLRPGNRTLLTADLAGTPHDLVRCLVVLSDDNAVKLDHATKFLGHRGEEILRIPMRGYRLR